MRLILAIIVLAVSGAVEAAGEVAGKWSDGAPRFMPPHVFGATPGRDFRHSFPLCGSRSGLAFLVVSGTLPEGVELDPVKGILSGRSAHPGEYPFVIRATNEYGRADMSFTLVLGKNARALTPPMGWTSWNAFTQDIDSSRIAASARALVARGLAAHGYAYVNIDSCWQGERDASDTVALQPNRSQFPDMKALVDEIHALGLKAGIYSTPQVVAWGSTDRRLRMGGTGYPIDPRYPNFHFGGCGKKGFEEPDAAQFDRWGFDWLKYDWNLTDVEHARRMRTALDKTGRDIVLQLCTECRPEDAEAFAEQASLVRGNIDALDYWPHLATRTNAVFKGADRWLKHIRPGFWYDLDMLALGVMRIGRDEQAVAAGERSDSKFLNRLTRAEQESHFAWWAILPAPLFLSCDLNHLDDFTLELVMNEDLIAINQDYPAKPAEFLDADSGRHRLWKRQLSDGRIVLGFFNLEGPAWNVKYPLGDTRFVRDVLVRSDVGATAEICVAVPEHGCKIYLCR